jgi:hypothetical protein
MITGDSYALRVRTAKPVATLIDTIDWRNRPYTTTCAGLSRSPFTRGHQERQGQRFVTPLRDR